LASCSFNLVTLLGRMAYVGAVMTLPGMAGFSLTIGMGVDSNVLIFERIKEELEAQRGVRASIHAGFQSCLPDAPRYAHRRAHLGGVSVSVRHRSDPRLRRDALDWAHRQPVYVNVRVENAL
jgi:hypothetical protein